MKIDKVRKDVGKKVVTDTTKIHKQREIRAQLAKIKIKIEADCWLWPRATLNGFGNIWLDPVLIELFLISPVEK